MTGPVECVTCGAALYAGWHGHRCPVVVSVEPSGPFRLEAALGALYRGVLPVGVDTGACFDWDANRIRLWAACGSLRVEESMSRADMLRAGGTVLSVVTAAGRRLVAAFAREVGGVGLAPVALDALERAGVTP